MYPIGYCSLIDAKNSYNHLMTIYDRNTDNRMLWIRELERRSAVQSPDDQTRYAHEHELVSECEIHGRLYYEEGLLSSWWTGSNSYISGLQTYALRLDLATAEEFKRTESGDLILTASEGGYFSRSLEDELISLMSLWLHTRFFWVHCTSGEPSRNSISHRYGDPFTYNAPKNRAQRKSTLFKGSRKTKKTMLSVSAILDAVKTLPVDVHRRYYLAAAHYADAIRWIGHNDEIAYIKLVSAIEVLAYREELSEDELPKNLRSLIDANPTHFSGIEKAELLSYLNQRKIRFKFVQFLRKYSDGYFTGRPTTPEHCLVTEATFEQFANAIYKARSRFLHEGEPMWISDERVRDDTEERGWDLDGSFGMVRDQHEWSGSEVIPTVLFFEEIVRHCLLNYLGVFPAHKL